MGRNEGNADRKEAKGNVRRKGENTGSEEINVAREGKNECWMERRNCINERRKYSKGGM